MSLVNRYLEPALVERLNQLQLTARSVVEGTTTGLHKSPLKGASIEFRQHRAYVPGDEPRRLDWRVLARTDRPFIKEYDEETNLRCVLMLDGSGSMTYGGAEGARQQRKFDYAAKLVASLAYLMLAQTESVGFALVGPGLQQWVPPASGSAQLSRLIDVLERAVPAGEASIGKSTQQVADRIGRRALVIAISDFLSPAGAIREGLARLRHQRHEVMCIRVLHRDEQEFPFRNWSRFYGLEGEPAYLCEPALVRRTYRDNFERHRQLLEAACRAFGADLHTFTTDRPVIEALTRTLS